MITVSWKDSRQMCGIKFIRLEVFLDSQSQGMPVYLEPQGILFAEVVNALFSKFLILVFSDSWCAAVYLSTLCWHRFDG